MLLPKNIRRLRLSLCFANNLQTLKHIRCLDTDIHFHANCLTYRLVDNLPNGVKHVFYKLYHMSNIHETDMNIFRRKETPVIQNCPSNAKLIWENIKTDYEILIHGSIPIDDIELNCVCSTHSFF